MKIAHIASTFPPYKGGIGNVCHYQVLELARLGHENTVFVPEYEKVKDEPKTKGIEVVRMKPVFKYGNAAFVPQLFNKAEGFDIVHLHYPFFGGAESVWLSKLLNWTKVPLVLQYHHDVVGKGFLRRFSYAYKKTLLSLIIKRADKVLVSTKDYARHSYMGHLIGCLGDRLEEVPFGVDENTFASAPADSKIVEKLGFGQKDRIIVFVGGLDKAHYFKGVDILIKAFNLVLKDKKLESSTKLLIVGRGDLKQGYEKLAHELGIGDKVVFADRVKTKDLPKYYNLAEFSVLSSIDKSEAFGLVLLEAMACGKPVIATELYGVRKVAKSGGLVAKVGDVHDLAEKMLYLLENDGERKRLGEKGRRAVEEKYNWKNIARRLEGIYKGLIK